MLRNQLSKVDFKQNLTEDPIWGFDACSNCHTDIPRLREGLLGAQVKNELLNYHNKIPNL